VSMKGIIIKKDHGKVIVLTEEATFRCVNGYQHKPVGCEINFSENIILLFPFMAVAAVFIMVVFLSGYKYFALTNSFYLFADINPSIELTFNNANRVRSAEGINDDGRDFLKDTDISGSIKAALKAIYDSATAKGYDLSYEPSAPAIQLTVVSGSEEKSQKICKIIQDDLDELGIKCAAVGYSTAAEMGRAQQLSLSPGKLKLILEAQSLDPTKTLQELADMPVKELNSLISSLSQGAPQNPPQQPQTEQPQPEYKIEPANPGPQVSEPPADNAQQVQPTPGTDTDGSAPAYSPQDSQIQDDQAAHSNNGRQNQSGQSRSRQAAGRPAADSGSDQNNPAQNNNAASDASPDQKPAPSPDSNANTPGNQELTIGAQPQTPGSGPDVQGKDTPTETQQTPDGQTNKNEQQATVKNPTTPAKPGSSGSSGSSSSSGSSASSGYGGSSGGSGGSSGYGNSGGSPGYTQALTFTYNSKYDIPASTVGIPIGRINVNGGVSGGTANYKFSAAGLPAGIAISVDGFISGTPTAASPAGTATITVTDSATPPVSRSITINCGAVAPAPLAFADDPKYDIPASAVGTAITDRDVSGGVSGGIKPYTFTATGLPSGIKIDPTTGVISGTPTEVSAGGIAYITVTDSAKPVNSKSITINYGAVSGSSGPSLTFNNDSGQYNVPPSTANVTAIDIHLADGMSGGTGTYTFTIVTGQFPAGITMDSGGHITGTPTTANASTGTVTIAVKDGSTPPISGTIVINYGAVSGSSGPTLTFNNGSGQYNVPPSTANVTAIDIYLADGMSGGTGTYTFTIVTGQFPAGITMDSGGHISGTPTTATAAGTVTIAVKDSSTPPISSTITISYGAVSASSGLVFNHKLPYDIPLTANSTAGLPIHLSSNVSGGTDHYVFTLTGGTLPIGVDWNSSGDINGKPTDATITPGTVTFTISDNNDSSLGTIIVDVTYGPAG